MFSKLFNLRKTNKALISTENIPKRVQKGENKKAAISPSKHSFDHFSGQYHLIMTIRRNIRIKCPFYAGFFDANIYGMPNWDQKDKQEKANKDLPCFSKLWSIK